MNTNLFYLLLFFLFSINCAVGSSDKSGTLIADENKPIQIASPKPSTKNDLTQNNQTNSKNTIATTTPTVDFQPELVSKEYQLLMQNLPTAETYLPKFDFKRKDYTKFYDRNEKGPRNGCLKTHHRKFYDFTHGVYRANPGNKVLGIKCYYSCQYDVNLNRVFGPYKKIGQITKPSCDVTRTKCLNVFGNPIYADVDLYLQKQKPNPIVEMPDLHPNYTIAVNGTKYSVHMIYIDSVGEFTFKRTMPKTDKLIKDMYKAFEFKYLHKVGENTAPNEKAFLMNKISETVIDVFKNRSSILKDIDLKTYCEMDKSKLSFAPRYFKQNGYKTMHAEDYWRSPLQYHDYCKGIEKFDHDIWTYNRPSWTDKTLINAWNSRCLESFQVTLDNLHSYITKYQNQNTYSFNFMTMLQHDSLNGLYHADDSFANFFKENTKQFENSFIIFSSDHGVRYGKYREQTDIAAYEDNNPFLRLIVPKALRSDKKFMELVKGNSRKYVSQYDVFATMIDVLTEGARTNFKDLNYVDFDKVMKYHVVGQSFLREMKERDEFEMGVPINYHFYKRHKVELNDTFYPEIKKFVIKRVIENINLELVSQNLTKICTEIFLKKKAAQHVYVVNIGGKAYFDFQVRTTPGTGIFIGMLDNNFQSIERVMRRVNSYAYEAESCIIHGKARQFCFCKKLLPG